MKRLKPIIYGTLLLIMIAACASDNDSLIGEPQQIDYEKLNLGLKENIISVDKMIEFNKSLSDEFKEFLEIEDESIFIKNDYIFSKKSTEEKVLYKKEDLSLVYTDRQKEFLINFYNELGNSEDGYILDIVLTYKELLKNQNFSTEEYNQIRPILLASEQSILVLYGSTPKDINYKKKSSFSSKSSEKVVRDCIRKKGGITVGKSIVRGAIFGAAAGFRYGVVGGAIVLPFFGTIAGGAGCAIFGAVGGAIFGAYVGAIYVIAICNGKVGWD
jgi:hypothetical protein